MELYFLDIGQGACHILLEGNQRAIVFDCGANHSDFALKFLKRNRIEVISRLIISHSDNDHIGGALSILGDYESNIEQIWFVDDGKFKHTRFYKRFVTLVEAGKMRGQQLKRLEVAHDGLGQPTVVWRDTPKRVALHGTSWLVC